MKSNAVSPTITNIITILKVRFEKNQHRHNDLSWNDIEKKLEANDQKLSVLLKMEETGGEPDVIGYDAKTKEFIFCDCSKETPAGRRSLCYDRKALNERKEHKPINNVIDMANEIGIKLLNEEEYRALQLLEAFDNKTSSWIETPKNIRDLGGALFGDCRYETVFIYHNGAISYYAARGFRGLLKV